MRHALLLSALPLSACAGAQNSPPQAVADATAPDFGGMKFVQEDGLWKVDRW